MFELHRVTPEIQHHHFHHLTTTQVLLIALIT